MLEIYDRSLVASCRSWRETSRVTSRPRPATNDPTFNFEQEILGKVGSFLAYAKAGMGSVAGAGALTAEASSATGAGGGASAPVDQSLDW